MPVRPPLNAAWTSHEMWRVAGALKALRRTIQESKTIVAASVLLRLERDRDSLERTRDRLRREAQTVAVGGTAEDRDALAQRIIQFYRDVGDLERSAAANCMGL